MADNLRRQCRERHNGIQTIAEFRREQTLDRIAILTLTGVTPEADGFLGHIRRTGIGGHDQDHVAEIDRLAVMVGQFAVVHHLQQDVVEILMRLLDLVEQQHAMRMLIDGIGEQTPLIEADIARRCTDQAADRMTLHVFGHIEPDQFNAQSRRQLPRHFGFAHTRRAREQIIANRLLRLPQPGTRQLDGCRQRVDGLILAEDH